jgi:hypothetical protein
LPQAKSSRAAKAAVAIAGLNIRKTELYVKQKKAKVGYFLKKVNTVIYIQLNAGKPFEYYYLQNTPILAFSTVHCKFSEAKIKRFFGLS